MDDETTPASEIPGHDHVTPTPEWAEGDMPDPKLYLESECFVAGAISTLPPFDKFHPAWALPAARQALDALSEWEPSE
jgi:hypothetical protein